uniref:Trypsin-2-like n=1 Tax=Sinocyclocheilus grahami TaxID=75366 RepID=A0A672S1H7_SINGR
MLPFLLGHVTHIKSICVIHLHFNFATYKALTFACNLHIKTTFENGKCKLYNLIFILLLHQTLHVWVMENVNLNTEIQLCGRAPLNPKIVGGQNAVRGSWPWQASINYVPNGGLVCGGSLINKDWVLSAAQCFQEYVLTLLTVSTTINKTVAQIIIHPKYNPDNFFENDIALVQLSSSVTFNDYIRPVCLAAAGSTFDAGTESWITGWGKLNYGGENTTIPKTLQEVNIPLVSQSDCEHAYERIIPDNILCAGPAEGGKGSCQGDGGGPLVINGSQWFQSGISIFGVNCTAPTYPGGYTRVSHYQDWISSHIKSDLPGFIKSSGFRSSPICLSALFPAQSCSLLPSVWLSPLCESTLTDINI